MKKITITKGKITGLVIGLILTAALFFVLVFIQREMLKDTEKTTVVLASRHIPAGTVLTETNAKDFLKEVEVSSSLAITDAYLSVTELFGKYVTRNTTSGEIIYDGIIGDEAEILSHYENPTELSITISEEAAAVAGTIRKGEYVNVYASLFDEYGNQSFQLILENELVNEVYDENMVKIAMSDTEQVALTFTLYLEAEEVPTLLDKLKTKEIFVVKVK